MFHLSAEVRKNVGNKSISFAKGISLPAILYGPGIKNIPLTINTKEFLAVHKKAGESGLISLTVGDKKFIVLVHGIQLSPLKLEAIHVDFYQPKLKEEITVEVPLVFEGESPAVKNLGGTLIKNFQTIEIKGLPEHLPHEIKVDIGKLQKVGDTILVRNFEARKEIQILKDANEVVAEVVPPEKVEEELTKPEEKGAEAVATPEEVKQGGEEKSGGGEL